MKKQELAAKYTELLVSMNTQLKDDILSEKKELIFSAKIELCREVIEDISKLE